MNLRSGDKKVALMDKIVELASDMPINEKDAKEKDAKRVVDHVVSEFSKRGIGGDYTGYH
jgi:hypothetical protein